MKKISIAIIIFCSLSCDHIYQLKPDNDISDKIKKEIYVENIPVNLSELTDFSWDSLIVLGPYTNIEQIEKKYDLDLTNINRNGIESSDWFNLIVFIKNNKSVKITEIDKSINPTSQLLPNKNIKLKLTKDGIRIYN